MRERRSYRALLVVSLALAAIVPLVCGARRAGNGQALEASQGRVITEQGASFPISASGNAVASFATGIFAPPEAPALSAAMADFTGDTNPDLATVELERLDRSSARYWIEIRLTEGGHQILKLRAPLGGLLVTPKDVTGDGNLDLVVRSSKSRVLVAVFLNDGNGHFSRVDLSPFANALHDGPSRFGFTAQQRYPGGPLAYLESSTVECPTGPFGYLQEQEGPLSLSSWRGASRLFLSYGANRAPPSQA